MTYLRNAAKWYSGEPHQQEAWDALEAKLPGFLVEEFKAAYRNKPPEPVKQVREVVSPAVFEQLTGYAASLFTKTECDDCNKLLHETGFAEHLEATRFLLANILHETANMKFLRELASGWAYEGRSDLGNTEQGDGPRFKGAGVLQLTGRHNYSRLAKDLGDPRVMEGVEYVASTYPFRSAKTWIQENDLLNVALNQGFDAVCRRINGGWNGYQDRKYKLDICRRVIIW